MKALRRVPAVAGLAAGAIREIRPAGRHPFAAVKLLAWIYFTIGVVLAGICQGSFIQMLVVAGFTVFILLPVGFVILVGATIGTLRRRGELPGWTNRAVRAWLVFAGSTLFSWILGVSFHAYQVASVERYVRRACEALDCIREKDGRYPEMMPVEQVGSCPKFLREQGSYWSDGRSFRFEYWDPAGMMGESLVFDSEARAWTHAN